MPYEKRKRTNDAAGTNGGGQPSVSGQRLQFVDGYLDKDDLAWLEDHASESDALILDLITESGNYGGMSCKFDEKSGKYLAILFGGGTPEFNSGYALTSRGASPIDALYALAYKHLIKFRRAWASVAGSAGNRYS